MSLMPLALVVGLVENRQFRRQDASHQVGLREHHRHVEPVQSEPWQPLLGRCSRHPPPLPGHAAAPAGTHHTTEQAPTCHNIYSAHKAQAQTQELMTWMHRRVQVRCTAAALSRSLLQDKLHNMPITSSARHNSIPAAAAAVSAAAACHRCCDIQKQLSIHCYFTQNGTSASTPPAAAAAALLLRYNTNILNMGELMVECVKIGHTGTPVPVTHTLFLKYAGALLNAPCVHSLTHWESCSPGSACTPPAAAVAAAADNTNVLNMGAAALLPPLTWPPPDFAAAMPATNASASATFLR